MCDYFHVPLCLNHPSYSQRQGLCWIISTVKLITLQTFSPECLDLWVLSGSLFCVLKGPLCDDMTLYFLVVDFTAPLGI